MIVEEAIADLMLAQADVSYRPKDDSIDLAIIALEKQKTGHWTYIKNSSVNGLKICECSNCNKRTYGSHNYCSNCGARMIEPQESKKIERKSTN